MPIPSRGDLSELTPKRTFKKSYKKSTKGCTECKLRKIKCNEVRPVCGNCAKRYVDPICCRYLTAERPNGRSSGHSSDTNSTLPSIDKSLSIRPEGVTHLLELKLMHHFTQTTGRFRSGKMTELALDSLWGTELAQMAFSSDIVLNSLLAIAALNLHSLQPEDRSLVFASRYYIDKAVVKHRRALDHVSKDNSEILSAAAVILAHYNWLATHSRDAQEPYIIDLKTYRMCAGAKYLLEDVSPRLGKYNFFGTVIMRYEETETRYDEEFMKKVSYDMHSFSEALDSKEIYASAKELYETVIRDITATCDIIATGRADISTVEQRIVTILHRLPQQFVQLLHEQESFAIGLLIRNMALLELLDDHSAWWIHGVGADSVVPRAVHGMRKLLPPEDLWIMDWPLKIVSGEIKVVNS